MRINEKKSQKGCHRKAKSAEHTYPDKIGEGIPPKSDRVSDFNRRYIDNKEDNINDNISSSAQEEPALEAHAPTEQEKEKETESSPYLPTGESPKGSAAGKGENMGFVKNLPKPRRKPRKTTRKSNGKVVDW